MTRAGHKTWQLAVAAVLAPGAAAVVLLPVRGSVDNTNTALLLTVPVFGIAVAGKRWAALMAAASAAVAFDFFHTLPYYRLTMRYGSDFLTAVLLFIVGLVSCELALRARQRRALSRLHERDIARIHAIAELVAGGEPAEFVVIAVAAELRGVLGVDDVQFERAPVTAETAQFPILDELPISRHEPPGHIALPRKAVLPITAGGRQWGRYTLTARPELVVSIARRAVALTLAHQVGIAMAVAAAAQSG